ncbi:MAG: DUF885 domain-containing protein [Sandaracinobacteroides sp.]
MRIPVLVAAILWAGAAAATPAADFRRLLDDHWAWWLAENPTAATAIGERAHDLSLPDLSLAALDRSAGQAERFAGRLAAIPRDGLSPEDRISAAVLGEILASQIEGNRFPARAMLFTNREGFHTSLLGGLPDQMPFFTKADYDSYLARLEAVPEVMDEAIATSREAVAGGYALPCVVMQGFETSVRQVVQPFDSSRFHAPLKSRPSAIPEADWVALQARAKAAIEARVNPAYARFADYIARDYMPACTPFIGVSQRPMGRDYYAWRARSETTTKLTPDEIHAIGLGEVARIRAEMEAVSRKAGFPDREAYVAHLRTDPAQYARTPQELMAAAGFQAKLIDGWMPRLFTRLPRLPYTVKEIPAEIAPGTTTAYYSPGSAAAGKPGVYFVNTSKLNERPLFELPALTIHEAVPGHHHQIALQQEMELPQFRRHAAFFTAFVEGWGLYSERLGIEMGVYDTPAKDMGRLSYEMWRATRLVVDTGIHWMGWPREKAVRFMLDNTALSAANIDAEVNRYIAWPGQALAYKIGELEIRRLRTEAEAELGPRFDLRTFHDKVLESGSVPLDVLQAKVRGWIAAEKAKG